MKVLVARSGDPGMVDEDIHGSLVRYTTVGKKISAKWGDGEGSKKQWCRFSSFNLFKEDVFRTFSGSRNMNKDDTERKSAGNILIWHFELFHFHSNGCVPLGEFLCSLAYQKWKFWKDAHFMLGLHCSTSWCLGKMASCSLKWTRNQEAFQMAASWNLNG